MDVYAEAGDWAALEAELRLWPRRIRGLPLLEAWWQRLQARLLAHQGKTDQAVALLRQSVGKAESIGARAEQGRSLGYLARVTGDAQTLAQAREILEQCQDRLALRLLRLD